MNLRGIVDKMKAPFDKGQKLEKLYPAFNAFETFLFVPNHTSKTGAHIRDGIDLKRVMITVIIALLPALFYGIYNTGYQYLYQTGEEFTVLDAVIHGSYKILPMIAVSYIVGLGIEFAFAVFRGHQVNEGYLVTGLLIPMIMPVDIPLWMVAISVAFAVLIGKEAFGGTGMNILNPALTARAFLFFAYPSWMSGDKVWVQNASVDGYSGATILGDLASSMNWQSLSGQWSMSDMFFGTIPGSVGETSMLAIILGALILLFTGVGSWRIILSTFLGGYFMAYLFNLWGYNELMSTPAHIHLMIGSFAFGAVFMATDPVTASQTNKGKYIYGFLIGVFAILIRTFNPAYPEGMMLAILLMNIFAPLIDHYIVQANVNKRLKRATV